MDSMRSLNTSLPASSPHPSRTQPPEQLLQAFKTAALSVTNLYKTAVSDQAHARHIGYQEALEDLRAFLEKEKIGLDDGEGSKVRSWVTDRIDGTATTSMDSDDERENFDKRGRSVSPAAVRKETPDANPANQPSRSTSPPRQEPTAQQSSGAADSSIPTRPATFTFTAGPQLPQQHDIDMQTDNASLTTMPIQNDSHLSHTSNITSPSVRLEVVPRGNRTPHRMNNNNRHNSRTSVRDTTSSTGSKRKFHFPDFFDISSFGNGRDAFGGGKRGRFL
ncbi:hypothetical protein FQN55_005022 [Onygenales sp. PD_40]|nr:hypothetical protein FQN55_005022 [Onygenales sp. PD_40]